MDAIEALRTIQQQAYIALDNDSDLTPARDRVDALRRTCALHHDQIGLKGRRIPDPAHGESAPSAPIAWDGLVYIGNSGGDYKGGKGHVFALEGKTGKIVWEFFLAPQVPGDVVRGPLGKTPLDMSSWDMAPGLPVSGAGTWTSYTLDIKNGLLYVPGGNPAPDFASGAREGSNLYTDSVVVLDAKTGD